MFRLLYPIVGLCWLIAWTLDWLADMLFRVSDFFDTLHYDLTYPIDKHKGKKQGYLVMKPAKKKGFFFR